MNVRTSVRAVADHRKSGGTKLIHLLPIDHFSLLSLTAAIDPLRVANRMLGYEAYKWAIISTSAQPIIASNLIKILPDYRIAEAPTADVLLLCASFDAHLFEDDSVITFLRRQSRLGVVIAGTGMAAFILAKAGLLAGRRCTLHWENIPAFVEQYPDQEVTRSLFELDGNIMTCSGGEATFDMFVHMVAVDHGNDIAMKICTQLIHDRPRTPHDRQNAPTRIPVSNRSKRLAKAVAIMEENVESPISGAQVAQKVGCTQRQLERLFKRHCRVAPREFYLDLRLSRARALLIQSDMSVLSVALACGFNSHNNFTVRYKQKFGVTPSEQRSVGPRNA